MKLNPQLKAPYAPILLKEDLQEEEREVAFSIEGHFRNMSDAARCLAAAVALYEFSKAQGAQDLYRDWLFVAARDGAMSLYNFGYALALARGLIGRIPSWLNKIDTKALKAAEKRFKAAFPFAEKMRHSVAHPELYSDPSKNVSISGEFAQFGLQQKTAAGSVVVQGSLSDDIFHSTFDGGFVHYPVTGETVKLVVDITIDCFNALHELDAHNWRGPFPRD